MSDTDNFLFVSHQTKTDNKKASLLKSFFEDLFSPRKRHREKFSTQVYFDLQKKVPDIKKKIEAFGLHVPDESLNKYILDTICCTSTDEFALKVIRVMVVKGHLSKELAVKEEFFMIFKPLFGFTKGTKPSNIRDRIHIRIDDLRP